MIIDLHTHTYPKSDDSFLTLEALVAQAKAVGLDGICLTDHDQFWDVQDLQALADRWDFPLFPGCEVTTEEGHLLVFGLDRYIFGMHKASFVQDLVREYRGALLVAHPYRRKFFEEESRDPLTYENMVRRACESSVFRFCHGVEVLNGRGSLMENAFSQEVARRFHLPGSGASDAHRLEDVGTCATEFPSRIRTLRDLIDNLRAGTFRPVWLGRAIFREPVPHRVSP
ncbi:MAG: PHP domain-containing protein [Dehalococcoidia bacterium]|nr:PHP domain-containing protein [Dehalococcoidia bacterium]MDW8119283.1 PHP domain-containing protein [Chloroflexota bacterium]